MLFNLHACQVYAKAKDNEINAIIYVACTSINSGRCCF